MKYQKGLKKTKDFLKNNPEPVIRDVCNSAGLTDKETDMIVLRFRKGKSRFHTSYDCGMCESNFSIKTTKILSILKIMLVKLGCIDGED